MQLTEETQKGIAEHVARWGSNYLQAAAKVPKSAALAAGISAGNEAARIADLTVRENTEH